jgi:hypothetical protein
MFTEINVIAGIFSIGLIWMFVCEWKRLTTNQTVYLSSSKPVCRHCGK